MPSTTDSIPFSERSSTHPLSAYLFKLMLVKQSNLCLSADVNSAAELLGIAAQCGPSIVVLKTHYDILTGWTPQTGKQLASLARRHGFLIFEDRKFSDIGSTVQKQYVSGPGQIVDWAHITNAHVLPGEAIVTSLAESAKNWIDKKNYEVKTDIYAGTPRPESAASNENFDAADQKESDLERQSESPGRKGSIVSVTTVSQHFEDAKAKTETIDEETFEGIGEPPLERGLLLLAQMSSAGNLLDAPYTQACVDIARKHKDFVMGFIAQKSLNTDPADQFFTMTPGCQLPLDGETEVHGDGKGQQYSTPANLIAHLGTDIIIVGRGIIKAIDPIFEAERYRVKGWEAYEERVTRK